MKDGIKQICPRCKKRYSEVSALSRMDNKTQICPECGIREALIAIGLDEKEQEKILLMIHNVK